MATTYFFITPPIKNTAWEFWCLLTSQANTNVFQTTVTLAAGDVTVFRDGTSLGNIDTLPTEVGVTGVLHVQLSTDEMNGDKFTLVKFHDAAGAEWQDKAFLIPLMQAVTTVTAGDVWDEVLTSATHDVGYSAGQRLRLLIITGAIAQAGTINSITLAAAESATDHIYNQNIVTIVGGTGLGQSRIVIEYNGTTKLAMVDRDWHVTPDATSVYEISSFSDALLLDHGIAQAGTATSITLAATALADDSSYVGSVVFISTGTGAGQARLVTAYVGATRLATVSPAWQTTPDATSIYKILPVGRAIVDTIGVDALAQINAEMDTALADVDLDHLIQVTAGTEEPADGSYLDQIMNKDASQTFDASTDSLEAVRDVLQSSTINVTSVVDGSVITIVRGDTLSADIDDLGSVANYTKLWFTVKRDQDDADSASILQVLLTNPAASGDGLQYLNGAAATPSQGNIVVDDAATGDITVTVDEAATAQLAEQACLYDVQVRRSTGVVKTLTTGECKIDADADITRATS